MNQDLVLEQRTLELEAYEAGVQRYHLEMQNRNPSERGPEKRLIDECLDRLIPALEQLQLRIAQRERMVGVRYWGVPLLSVPAEHLAVITLTTLLDHVGSPATATAFKIAYGVRQERYHQEIMDKAPDVLAKIKRFAKHWSPANLRQARKKANLVIKPWPMDVNLHVGTRLLETAIETLPEHFKRELNYNRGRKQAIVTMSYSSLNRLWQHHEYLAEFATPGGAMVCEPVPWTEQTVGGFLLNDGNDSVSQHICLLKWKEDKANCKLEDLGGQHAAVNTLQKTRWRINKRVLDAVNRVYESGGGRAGLVLRDPMPLPPKPHDIATNQEARLEWRRAACKTRDDNAALIGQRSQLLNTITEAQKKVKYETLWFVWRVDFRGRLYPDAKGLSPQGDDVGRALLEFADPQPLGPDGFYWLTIHLANCCGIDKCELKDRVAWVEQNKEMIHGWADDPMRNKEWMDESRIDSPFKALAAAIEWSEASRMDDPADYLSRCPVSMDGTCNGLQWLSAIGRDRVGASATNLVKSEKPNDLYGEVANKSDELIEGDIRDWVKGGSPTMTEMVGVWSEDREDRLVGEKQQTKERGVRREFMLKVVPKYRRWIGAHNWRGKVNRKVAKRPAMTSGYGVTKQGIRTQLINDGFLKDIDGDLNINADYIRDVTHEAIGEVIIKAREIMEWFQECARIVNKTGHPICWTSPSGMKVNQKNMKLSRRNIRTQVTDYYYRVNSEDAKPQNRKQINSLPPNFTHSVDAAHMTAVVLKMHAEGVRDLLMIHDSFGAHACSVSRMHQIIRQTFADIASRDLLDGFRRELEKDLGVQLPDPPELGDYDPMEVLEAVYAFC